MPAIVLLRPSSATITTENVIAASVLPTKIWPREHDRVSTVFHVDWRSSLAKMSPATTLAIRGKPAIPAKPSSTNGVAKPEDCTHRPNSQSAGTDDWVLMKIANANGASRQITAAAGGKGGARIFAISPR